MSVGRVRLAQIPLLQSEKRNSTRQSPGSGGQTMASTKHRPAEKIRMGRFQVSLWFNEKILAARHDCAAEQTWLEARACIQHGQWNKLTREWDNQTIWCSVDELRDLVQALDGLNDLAPFD